MKNVNIFNNIFVKLRVCECVSGNVAIDKEIHIIMHIFSVSN